jgi:hypothetical protein
MCKGANFDHLDASFEMLRGSPQKLPINQAQVSVEVIYGDQGFLQTLDHALQLQPNLGCNSSTYFCGRDSLHGS